MSFAKDLAAFTDRLRARETVLFGNVVQHVEESIKVGSPVTGAPGQPVDTGALLNSWETEHVAPRIAEVTTSIAHAVPIENNERGAQLRSSVGGFGSVKLTRMGFPAIVDHETDALK